MPKAAGSCDDSIEKWFYNLDAGVCETFEWSKLNSQVQSQVQRSLCNDNF